MIVLPGSAATFNSAATGTQAIGRTLAVLDLFRVRGDDLGISEIAEELGLSGGTVHRIVRALVNASYLAQSAVTERYYLGRSAVLLGQAANAGLGLHRAQSVLERIGEETGESVNLGVRDGDEVVVVIRSESKHTLRISQEPGSRLPVYATAMGKAILSHGPTTIDEAVAVLAKPLAPLTPRTITSEDKLRLELSRIAKRGYSIDDEEAIAGVRCIAAPILGPDGTLLAAMAVQGPTVRMPRSRLTALTPLVVGAAGEVARVISPAHRL